MANTKISALTSATTPLAGTEVLPIVQGGATVKVSVDNLTTGKPVSMSNLTYTGTLTGGTDVVNLGSGQFYKDASGNVMVGTTSQILGGIFSVLSSSTAGSFRISAAAGAGIVLDVSRTAASGDMVYFRTGSTNLAGYITCPTASTTSYLSISDYRLKENVLPMTGALAKILQLKPVTYTWKTDGLQSQGFIAHELQAVVPDCVVGTKDALDAEGKPRYQGVDTSFLVATLTAAIQEQQALITQLQADVSALKGN